TKHRYYFYDGDFGSKRIDYWYVRHGYILTGERKPFVIPDTRWGIPKKELEFVVLEKKLIV
ncbi:MAG TPA: hypothetical protein PKC10_00875, partial [Cyclobacteriaceae bacterium]|nr:hypothetical protein [Cyclobacteriaceae bacterium]